jgi:hypothetical protein
LDEAELYLQSTPLPRLAGTGDSEFNFQSYRRRLILRESSYLISELSNLYFRQNQDLYQSPSTSLVKPLTTLSLSYSSSSNMAGGAPGASSRGRGGKFRKFTRGGKRKLFATISEEIFIG